MSDIEADTVEALIEDRYAAAMEAWESPWVRVVKDKGQISEAEAPSEVELENKFYQGYVFTFNSTRSRLMSLQQHRQTWTHGPSCY